VWTGCGQRALYTTSKHGGLADRAIMELVALLDFLTFSLWRLDLRFSGTFSAHTLLGPHAGTVELPCHVPQRPGVNYSIGIIVTKLLPNSTRYYCEPSWRELRERFTPGASASQTPTIKLGRGTSVRWRDLK